jgi:cytochrome c5
VDTALVYADSRVLVPLLLLCACACACSAGDPPAAAIVLSAANARTYQAACATCHARPGIGAPLTGVDEDWRQRREQGLDALLVHTVDGYGGMPPLGTCGLCSEDDLRVLIRYMAGLP